MRMTEEILREQSAKVENEVDLRDIWARTRAAAKVVWKQRRWMLKIAAAGFVVSVVIALLIPNQYESTARIVPPDPQAQSMTSTLAALMGAGALTSASGLATSLLSAKSPAGLTIATLKSNTVQNALIDQFDLRAVYHKKYYYQARKTLGNETNIEEDHNSGIIEITVTDKDPLRAQKLAGAYVVELDKVVSQLNMSAARRERIFLEERLKSVKAYLDLATLQLSEFSSHNATIDITGEGKAILEAAAKLQGELIAARAELRGLEAMYAPENVRVRALKARIDELNRQLEKINGTSIDSTQEMEASDLYPSLRKLPLLGVKYYDLYRTVKIQEAVYEVLTKQYELAKVQEAKEISTLKVLDPPNLPERKSSPHRTLIALFGTLFAVSVGAAWLLRPSWMQVPLRFRKHFGGGSGINGPA